MKREALIKTAEDKVSGLNQIERAHIQRNHTVITYEFLTQRKQYLTDIMLANPFVAESQARAELDEAIVAAERGEGPLAQHQHLFFCAKYLALTNDHRLVDAWMPSVPQQQQVPEQQTRVHAAHTTTCRQGKKKGERKKKTGKSREKKERNENETYP